MLSTLVLLALIHWNVFKFVDEVGVRIHEKVALQNPDLKRKYAKIFRSMCVTFSRDQYISLHYLNANLGDVF